MRRSATLFGLHLGRGLLLGLLLLLPAGGAVGAQESGEGPTSKFVRGAQPLPGRYIVVLEDADTGAMVQSATDSLTAAYGGTYDRVYQHALKGFALEASEEVAQAMSADPRVKWVEEDQLVSLDGTQSYPPSWGLDRIDQWYRPLNQSYFYPATGAGVKVFVIDTGIDYGHSDFGGRAQSAYDVYGLDGSDCNGHGTHVAGTIGGSAYGVAKGVTLHSVRVLDCAGNGPFSSVIAGVDYVAGRVLNVPGTRPAVVNMSLGGPVNYGLDQAVANSIAAGATYVVAAGNANVDAGGISPARVGAAVTVAASDINDVRAGFSNYGSIIDLFAPGESIRSTWPGGGTATLSGTSMASPHVAGAAALYLQEYPAASPAAVTGGLLAVAVPNAIFGVPLGTPNRFLHSLYYLGTPSNATASGVTGTQISLSWVDNSRIEQGFVLERSQGGPGSYQWIATVGPNTTSHLDPGLQPGTTYFYRLYAFHGPATSYYSNETSATTAAPPTVSSVTVSPTGVHTGATLAVSWSSTLQNRYEVFLCDPTGANCGLVASANPSTARSAAWAVPIDQAPASHTVKVKVWSTTGSSAEAQSSPFTIKVVTVAFQFVDLHLPEPSGATTTTVRLTTSDGAPTTADVSVSYMTANGTAQAGADYGAVASGLTFPAGTGSGATRPLPVAIPIHDDGVDENDEDFFASLFNPQRAILGARVSHQFIILDNDPQPLGAHDGSDCLVTTGWACDGDDFSQPLQVHLYDGPAGQGTFVGAVQADVPRDAAVGQLCGGNPAHGFRFFTPASLLDDRPHTIHAYAVSIGDGGYNPLLGGSPKTIQCGANRPPIGYLDQVRPTGFATGWTLDPDAPDQAIAIHVYLDGPAGQGQLLGSAVADRPRPDVNQVTGYPGNHGFRYVLPESVRDGQSHTLYVYAIDAAGGVNPLLAGAPLSFVLP